MPTYDDSTLRYDDPAWTYGGETRVRTVEVARRVAVKPGQAWTMLVEAKSTAGVDVCPYFRLSAGDADFGATSTGPDQYTRLTDSWQQLVLAYVVPTDGSINGIIAALSFTRLDDDTAGDIPPGSQIAFRSVALLAAPSDSAYYFDGSTPSPTGDYVWEGTPHNSRSHYYDRRIPKAQRLLTLLPRFLPLGIEVDLVWGQSALTIYGMPWGIATTGHQPEEQPGAGTIQLELRWRFVLTYNDLTAQMPAGATYDMLASYFSTFDKILQGRYWTFAEVMTTYASYNALLAAETSYGDLKDGPF